MFPKMLRNMWLAVAIFNPLISFLSLGLLPLARIQEVPPHLLAEMGELSFGRPLATLVSIDAVLVLSGAVLTSYVGVTGLVRRMALDRCLPQGLLHENALRKTNHRIIVGFFLLCTSILLVTGGRIELLAGVYTLSFLSVMALFALGNMLLKRRRARLPRTVRAGWPTVTLALLAVLIGLAGNVLLDPANVRVFAGYVGAAVAVVGVMFVRLEILRLGLAASRVVLEHTPAVSQWIKNVVREKINTINNRAVVYFTRGDDVAVLNRAALYVLENEQTRRMRVVRVYEEEGEIPADLAKHLATIDRIYPQLRVDFLAVKGAFGPELIERLSRRLDVPKNYMFIGTPGDRFPHRIEDLGGGRGSGTPPHPRAPEPPNGACRAPRVGAPTGAGACQNGTVPGRARIGVG